jgi:hypothetical protein
MESISVWAEERKMKVSTRFGRGGSISRSGLEAQATLTVLVPLLSTDAVGESPL